MSEEERDWIARCLQGEEGVFAQLIAPHKEKLYHHCLSLVKDHATAEDILQEGLLHAYQKLASFKGRASFGTWLWRVVHNTALNYLKREKAHFYPLEEERVEQIPSASPPLDIEAYLERLSPGHRCVVEMALVEKVPQKEIAKRLRIPYGTVRSRLHYARRQLRQHAEKTL